jgi:dTDP-4-dehydrorhamnose 3,5-epimerase-like enzyme
MPELIAIPSFEDKRGILYVIDKILTFSIRRIYFIKSVPKNEIRGGHRHKLTWQAAICVSGSCTFTFISSSGEKAICLDNPNQCLIISPDDWHEMKNFSDDAILLVLASLPYDKDDYITSKN